MKRRHFVLLLGGGSSGVLTVGTGAFSNMEAERGVAVSVANDRNAYVRYHSKNRTLPADLDNSKTITLVTVTNQFNQKVEITDAVLEDTDAALEEGANSVTDLQIPDSKITPGNSAAITATPTLETGETVEVAITVSVKGTGVAAEVFGDTERRRFTLAREESAGPGSSAVVQYNGKGTIKVREGDDRKNPTTVDVYTVPNGNPSDEQKRESLSDPKTEQITLGENTNFSQEWVVAVVVDGTVYQHPGWSNSMCGFESPSSGDGIIVEDPPTC